MDYEQKGMKNEMEIENTTLPRMENIPSRSQVWINKSPKNLALKK